LTGKLIKIEKISLKGFLNKSIIFNSIIFVLAFLFTFPELDPIYSTGLDYAYFWAYNYLFQTDYNSLLNLIYPYGPFGFLKLPLCIGNNFYIGVLTISFIRICLILSLLFLSQIINKKRFIINGIVIFILSYFSNFDYSIVLIVASWLIIFHNKNKLYLFIIPLIFASFGLFVKSSIGVTSFSIITIYIVSLLFCKINWKKSFSLIGISFFVYFLFGFIVFGSIISTFNFTINTFKVVLGYSAALTYFQENNIFYLLIIWISVLIFPFLKKEKDARLIFFMMLPALFMAWKHAMVREDITHATVFFEFLILFWGIIFLATKKIKFYLPTLAVISILFYVLNLSLNTEFESFTLKRGNIANFTNIISNRKEINENAILSSQNNLNFNKLNNDFINVIGNSTIDIYPFDITYISANNLNWKPRTTLQSGAYNEWWDNESAKNFTSEKGPEFILFHLLNDNWGGNLASFDDRYLFNDEPNTILKILENYSVVNKDKHIVLFKKNQKNVISEPKIISSIKVKLNEWIDVPKTKSQIFRAKIEIQKNIFGKLKSFFFKDEYYFIEYKLTDGSVIKYRFIPTNAKTGIWISPFILDVNSTCVDVQIVSLKLTCSNNNVINNDINIDWETFSSKKTVNEIFNKEKSNLDCNYLIFSKNDFEKTYVDWSIENQQIDTKNAQSGTKSNLVPKDGYSCTYVINLQQFDSLNQNISVYASVWGNYSGNSKAKFVISLEEAGDANFWDSRSLSSTFEANKWGFIAFRKEIPTSTLKSGIIKIYVWNPESEEIFIDDFCVKVF
jgi:hypothetical protein